MQYKKISETTNVIYQTKLFLYVGFFLFLPISQKISTIIILLLTLATLLSYNKTRVYLKKELLLLILFYSIYSVSLLYSSNFQISVLEKKASFLAFPLIFILDKDLKFYTHYVLRYYIYGCLVAILLCEFNSIFNSFNFVGFSFDSRANLNFTFFDSIKNNENYLFSEHFSFLHQTVYFSMYLTLGIVIMSWFKVFKKKTQYLVIFLFAIVIVQILNKAGIIVLFLVFGLKLYYAINGIKNKVISLLALLSIAIAVFLLNPRIKAFNTIFNYEKPEMVVRDLNAMPNTERSGTNTRIIIWLSALELIKENTMLGIGAGGSHKKLYERVALNQQHYDKRHQLHAHNQYLQVLLDIGIVGFLIFIMIFASLVGIVLKKIECNNEKLFVLGFLLIVAVNSLFESIFERYSGISLFCGFYCLIICLFNSRAPSCQKS
ncbi:O-antigen ligase family protein [Gelatiniphilus marinus]|uniref:O-antigen ligase family protein n=1 Tax=Gelatiniphilus marinus TaxID=1759464 RepID=A0ABW5JTF5_9FLAO